jgi:predicted kinase
VIIRPETRLVLVRGIPGSGKSTFAQKVAALGFMHVENDQFFMKNGQYQYDPERIGHAVAWARRLVQSHLEAGRRVVVANTFVRVEHLEEMLAMARKSQVFVAKGEWKNIHGVPSETIERMAQAFEPHPMDEVIDPSMQPVIGTASVSHGAQIGRTDPPARHNSPRRR